MQDCKVISYASRQLKMHEKNYPTNDHELAYAKFVLQHLTHYLNGVHLDVFTDHISLQYVFIHRYLKF